MQRRMRQMNPYVKVLLLGSYTWFFGEGLLGPLFAVFAERIGGDILELTGAYASYMLAAGALTIFIGRFSDRHRTKKAFMVSGYALNALATFGYLAVDRPWQLFAVQALLGIANALATPTWNALFSRHVDDGAVGIEWGLSDGVPKIIYAMTAIIGGAIVTAFGFRALFLTMGIIQVIATIVQSFVFPVSTAQRQAVTR